MISPAFNMLDSSLVDPLTGTNADASGIAESSANNPESRQFAELISDLYDGENAASSQPDGSGERPLLPGQGLGEEAVDNFLLPGDSSPEVTALPVSVADISAPITTKPPATAHIPGTTPITDSATSGKPLPLAGNPLPQSQLLTEPALLTSQVTGKSAEQIAASLRADPENEPEPVQRLQQFETRLDRYGDSRNIRENSFEHLDPGRVQNETMIRERVQQQTAVNSNTGLISPAASSLDSAIGMPGKLNNPFSNSQGSNSVTVTPVFDSGADTQISTESRTTAKADTVLRDQFTTPLGNLRWHADFAGKLRVLSQANVSTVELNLNPAELGVIDIKISSLDDGTVINFFSANPNTREILDTSLPRLRELLADSGIQLQHGDVSDRKSQPDKSGSEPLHRLAIELPEELNELIPGVHARRESISMIDHYV